MIRNKVHRGILATVFAAALVLAAERPASAQGLSWSEAWDWLGRLWSGVTLLQPPHQAMNPEIAPSGSSTADEDCGTDGPCLPPPPPGDCGPEIDPNGGCRG